MLRAASKFCGELEALVTTRALLGPQIRRHSIKTVLCKSSKDAVTPTTTSAPADADASATSIQSDQTLAQTSSPTLVQSTGPSIDPTLAQSTGPSIDPTLAQNTGPSIDPTLSQSNSQSIGEKVAQSCGRLGVSVSHTTGGEGGGSDSNRWRDNDGNRTAAYRLGTIGVAIAATAAIGGALYYKKKTDLPEQLIVSDRIEQVSEATSVKDGGGAVGLPAALRLPARVEFLVAGGGAAGAGGARTLRALDPEARVLIVGEEESLPYPRAPLSKQLWSDPEQLAKVAPSDAHKLTYTRWDGKTRNLAFEPESFYLPVSELEASGGGVSVARGWRVERLHVDTRTARLRHVATGETHSLVYGQCLIATGAQPLRHPALHPVRDSSHCGALHSVRGAGALARAVSRGARSVALVGDSERALELATTLRTVCGGSDNSKCSIIQILPGSYPLQHALPPYLQREVTAMLTAAGVKHIPNTQLISSEITQDDRVRLHLLSDGLEQTLDVDYVVECLGYEADRSLAEASDLAVGNGPNGGICVSPTLQAAEGVWAAGAAMGVWCRRAPLADSHEHALATARTAARNMTTRDATALTHHAHRALAWCDISPHTGYEAVGVIDSSLRTVGIFSDDSIAEDSMFTGVSLENVSAPAAKVDISPSRQLLANSEDLSPLDPTEEGPKTFKKGVVFYLDKNKIVGVLLWNLFNRSHIARQALLMEEVTDNDLVELSKHFSPQEA